MPYTLWHCGVLIGETDFEGEGSEPRQRAGIFRPTQYGRQLFPRLTGMLSAAAELKDELQSRGLSEEAMEVEGDAISDLFETTSAGRKVVDIGRVLSEVELRAPTGAQLEFASIGFMDLAELTALSRRLQCESEIDLTSLPPEAPQLIVSATLREPVFNRR